MTFTYNLGDDIGRVRLLLNDVDEDTAVFSDEEIEAFLDLEGNSVKRAAAQAIDTNADDQALASKVLKDHQISTDGARLADSLRKRAAELRRQADLDDEDAGFYFDVVDIVGDGRCGPELTSGY